MDFVQAIINGGGGLALVILGYRIVQLEKHVKEQDKKIEARDKKINIYRRDFNELKELAIEFVMIFQYAQIKGLNGQMKKAVGKWNKWRDAKSKPVESKEQAQ